jgi:hypothetical protein
MRCLLFALCLAAVMLPGSASAARPSAKNPWRSFSSKTLGFSLSYPKAWKLTASNISIGGQASLSYAGRTNYGLTIFVIPIRPARFLRNTLSSFLAYERSMHITAYAQLHWTLSSVAGHPAMAAVAKPATEGGAPISDGIYLTQSTRHVYQIEFVAYHKPPLSRLSQFPAVYSQILRTLRFY